MITIYALLDGYQVRHIGKTKMDDLQEKLTWYLQEASKDPDKFRWISDLLKEGRIPVIRHLLSCSEEEVEKYEKQLIKDYKRLTGIITADTGSSNAYQGQNIQAKNKLLLVA